MKPLEEMIKDNRTKLIEFTEKVLELVQKEDYNTIENLSYIQQACNGVFQFGTAVVEQNEKLESLKKK